MKYRDMLGFPKKKSKKKVIPESPKPSITKKLKEEFGLLNEWSEKPTGPKRWFKPMDEEGLTEFEREQMNEGPAYEYDKYLSEISKNYDKYWKSVTNFADVLHNKGFQKEAKVVERAYIKNVKMGFSKLLEKVVGKLM